MSTLELQDTPAKKAARQLLADKFDAVRARLAYTLDTPSDAEGIHKLRVATRRATAAVDAFAPCLSRRAHKQARNTLRHIRRTAGAARDWDVFFPVVALWADAQPAEVRPFADALLGWSAAKRDSAQAGLLALANTPFDAVAADTLAALRRPRSGASAAVLGRERIETLRAELAAACEHEPVADAEFHRVRILGKRLRYAVELFPGVLPHGEAEQLDAAMRALQDVLGRFNDGVVGAGHVRAFADHFRQFHPVAWERVQLGADALDAHFAALRAAERERFREWRERPPASRAA